MQLLVGCGSAPIAFVIPDESEFAKLAAQPRTLPNPALVARGRQVFLQGPCAMCHTIRGTIAHSRVGPDLTHLASRTMIAAGTLPNTRGHMAAWIMNPENVKPGAKMPPVRLGAADLNALLVFLESLK